MTSKLPKFKEDATLEAIGLLLDLAGGRMRIRLLLELLYMSDRKAWGEWGRPITYDSYGSTIFGQVPAGTFSFFGGGTKNWPSSWQKYLTYDGVYSIALRDSLPKWVKLSRAGVDIIKSVYEEYKHQESFTKKLPEYSMQGAISATSVKTLLWQFLSLSETYELLYELESEADLDEIFESMNKE